MEEAKQNTIRVVYLKIRILDAIDIVEGGILESSRINIPESRRRTSRSMVHRHRHRHHPTSWCIDRPARVLLLWPHLEQCQCNMFWWYCTFVYSTLCSSRAYMPYRMAVRGLYRSRLGFGLQQSAKCNTQQKILCRRGIIKTQSRIDLVLLLQWLVLHECWSELGHASGSMQCKQSRYEERNLGCIRRYHKTIQSKLHEWSHV